MKCTAALTPADTNTTDTGTRPTTRDVLDHRQDGVRIWNVHYISSITLMGLFYIVYYLISLKIASALLYRDAYNTFSL